VSWCTHYSAQKCKLKTFNNKIRKVNLSEKFWKRVKILKVLSYKNMQLYEHYKIIQYTSQSIESFRRDSLRLQMPIFLHVVSLVRFEDSQWDTNTVLSKYETRRVKIWIHLLHVFMSSFINASGRRSLKAVSAWSARRKIKLRENEANRGI
jgi:hypothetical protein